MAINPNITLSTTSTIENAVQQNSDGFSTVDTMGSLVNNVKFKRGYDDFANGKTTEQSYVWQALSAVSQDLGQSLYLNVKNYIDNVSNVDTCKVRALKSMMRLIGSDYDVIDKVGYYPIEIQNLIDIMSISKKYLLNNKFIKKDFLDSMCSADALSCLTPYDQLDLCAKTAYDLSDYSLLSNDPISSSVDYYMIQSPDAFDAYVSSVYANFIYDMLDMHGTGSLSNVSLYKTGFLSSVYGPNASIDDRYLLKKKMMNVNIDFNVEQVVNDIDVGIDSLDNYTGEKLSLLNEEISYRKSPASGLSCLDLATRNIYYRKQKVVEYAEFVDNMVFLPVNFANYVDYQYDKNYLTMLSNVQNNMCISGLSSSPSIVSSHVEFAAMSLAHITKYIAKIRDSIKFQTRKIFMKGTENLLRYTANEFIIDYIESLKSNLPYEQVSAFIEKLSAHSINDIAVQEYWDLTEYMNLSTSTTQYAQNKRLVNDRFFDQTFARVNDQLVPTTNNIFSNEELNKFYLDRFNLANTLFPALSSNGLVSNLSSNLYEFLSALFDTGANTSYRNPAGKFGMRLENGVITEQIDDDLSSIKDVSSFIEDGALSTGFSFDTSSSIEQQMNDFSRQLYDVVLSNERQDVSSIFDLYSPTVNDISAAMGTLVSEFQTFLTSTYSNYFCKSSSMYCYNDAGEYILDYYVDNPNYQSDSFVTSSQSAKDWIQDDNCYTFSLSIAIESLSSAYDSINSQLTSLVYMNDLETLGFVDPQSNDLGAEMDSIKEFMNSQVKLRNTYLQEFLQDLKSQASQLKSQYDSTKATFSSVLASLPSLPHQDFYMVGYDGISGNYMICDPFPTADKSGAYTYIRNPNTIYDAVSHSYYVYDAKNGRFDKKNVENGLYLDELYQIEEDFSLEKSIATCLDLVEFVNTISFGASTAVSRGNGTQKQTLQSLQTSISEMNALASNVFDQARGTYGLTLDWMTETDNMTCVEKIEFLTKTLAGISEQDFCKDKVLVSYNTTLSTINAISSDDYLPAKSSYDALWTEFDTFFTDYTKGADYITFMPSNLSSIDKYRQSKDLSAIDDINAQFDNFNSQYDSLLTQFIQMCNNNVIQLFAANMKQYRYMFPGSSLEFSLSDLDKNLNTDVRVRELIASQRANEVVQKIQDCLVTTQSLYQKYFPDAISYLDQVEYIAKFNAMTTSFMSIVATILDKLEYGGLYEYVYSQDFFKNYSGVPEIATDPYYNSKNQTHPSFQIHPFMWNFIEHHRTNNVIDEISKSLVSLEFNMLESMNALSAVDAMLGDFGNVIDVWKNNSLDFTGYTSKYEQSNHICDHTGKWSEVVGYEGAFYPPALDEFLSGSTTVDSLDEFYNHLNLNEDQELKDKIDSALNSSKTGIRNITSMKEKKDVYDIFRYCTDEYGNAYILYKKYSSESPTEQEKLHTAGQLWIRLADTPIAVEYKYIADINLAGSTLSAMDGRFCDICMLETGTKLIVTGRPYKNDSRILSKPLYIQFDIKNLCGTGHLSFTERNPYSNDIKQSDLIPNDAKSIHDNYQYKYLGSFNMRSTNAAVAYIRCNKDGSIPDTPVVTIASVTQEDASSHEKNVIMNDILNVICDFPVVSHHFDAYNDDLQYVDVLFATAGSNSTFLLSPYTDLSAGTIHAAEGAMIDDFTNDQMNSFDLIQDKLVMKSIPFSFGESTQVSKGNALQLNTDMGYLPSYPYSTYENVLDIKDDLNSSYQMVELLGKSKDVESISKVVNETPDPYISKKRLFDNYMYGRIYEDDGIRRNINDPTSVSSMDDYDEDTVSFNDSINIYSNWSMYQNMPAMTSADYSMNYVNGHYLWTILLDNAYTYDKLRKLKLFIYSTSSLGRNPYVVADMKDVIDKSNHLDEYQFLSTNYSPSRFKPATYSFDSGVFTMTVNGTQNGVDQVDSQFSNALPNIEDFSYKYSTLGSGMKLVLDFKLKDINAGGYIEKDVIKVVLADMFDLSFYNWYHFLDPGVTSGDYEYVVNRLSGWPLQTSSLTAIDFADYDYLSDIQVNGIQIFSTNNRLQFKAGEEDIFSSLCSNYYIPCLNTKYPLTFSQAFGQMYDIPDDQLYKMVRIYEPDEVFDLEVADSRLISAIHDIQLKYTDVVDDYRVFEDYYDVQANGIDNNTRFSTDDPYFYHYVHFVVSSDNSYVTGLSDALSIPDQYCDGVRITGTDPFTAALNSLSADPMQGERDFDHKMFTRHFDISTMSDEQRDKLIEYARTFMRLYVAYNKTDDGIVLYVNFQNYTNSPYAKMENGNVYSTTIDNTYLKVFPNESGLIDIVIQFKQYINGVLMGIDNVTIATCKIYNVSDDKPKLVIERMSQIS